MGFNNILIIGTKGTSSNILFNFLERLSYAPKIIIEKNIPPTRLIRSRIKKLGIFKVFGQLIFQGCITPVLRIFSSDRIKEITTSQNLNISEIAPRKIQNVKTVNSQETIDIINRLKPDLILLSGCRIISNKTLRNIRIPIVNIHAGITPKYRGVHGGYWAITANDIKNFGVTLHYVDEGIDTGNVIAQKNIIHDPKDNFTTYPLLQIAEGLNLLKDFIENRSELRLMEEPQESSLWYHPTVWGYLYNRIFNGIK